MRSRVAQLTHLRFQIRCHVKRERQLLYLLSKACEGNKVEAEQELVRVRRHMQEAGEALAAFLRGQQHTSK